ncbi:MAG: AAA-like domain-containing protein [Bacteroidota bacterium]
MPYFKVVHQLRDLVEENKLKEAFDLLKKQEISYGLKDTILLNMSTFHELKKVELEETATAEERAIKKNKIGKFLLDIANELDGESRQKTKVFISYSHKEPDRSLAQVLHKQLSALNFDPFLASLNILIGENWPQTLLNELKSATYFLILLSERSSESEMVYAEMKKARELQAKNEGVPFILPVRVQMDKEDKLSYDLTQLLGNLQTLDWQGEGDTTRILKEIEEVIVQERLAGEPFDPTEFEVKEFLPDSQKPLPKAPLEPPTGAAQKDSPFYIVREGEESFKSHLMGKHVLMRIKAPRQFGKTSLLNRIIYMSRDKGMKVVSLNFQRLTEDTISDLSMLLRKLCKHICRKLRLKDEVDAFWEEREGEDLKDTTCMYMEDYVLDQVDGPFVLAMDEVDRVFQFDKVYNDFFGMLRYWHEEGKAEPAWEKVKMVITYSTEAYLGLMDINQSPFANVGEDMFLQPFTENHLTHLIDLHGVHIPPPELEKLKKFLGGHPYLIRRFLYEMASSEAPFEKMLENANKDDGPFGDHLKRHHLNLSDRKDCLKVLKEILNGKEVFQRMVTDRLLAAGLIKGSTPRFEAACELYDRYFREKL